ncbi:MAG: LysR family transcriptional regulator [Kofleriaceae bacterium]|nr:LysR family transcriptional regulator [Kofleriaceae bacterium]
MVLNSRQLLHFLAVVDHGSLGRAAKALHISEPAISKSVRILEDALQVKLFDRGPRGLELTTFGESLVGHARVIAVELQRATLDVNELRGTQAGHVHVGAGPSFASSVLPRAVARLRAARPGIRVSISEGYAESMVPRVLHGELDFALMTLEAARPDPELVQEPLAQDEAVIVVRAAHPLAGRTVELSELCSYTWLLTKKPDLIRVRLEELFKSAHLEPPPVAVEFASLSFACAMLREDDVISFLPRSVIESDLARGDLAVVSAPGGSWRRSIGVLYRRHASQSPACQAMLSELRRFYGRLAPRAPDVRPRSAHAARSRVAAARA